MNSEFGVSEEVLTSLRQIIQAIDLHSKYLAKNYNLTGPQLLILRKIAHGRETSIGGIAKEVSLSQATVTSIIDRLEKLKYVQRKRSEKDKRRVIVTLTQRGMEKLKKNPSLLQEHFMTEFEKLQDWEQTLILSSIQRVASMMKARELVAKPVLTSGPISATAYDIIEFFNNESQSDGEKSSKDRKDITSQKGRQQDKTL